TRSRRISISIVAWSRLQVHWNWARTNWPPAGTTFASPPWERIQLRQVIALGLMPLISCYRRERRDDGNTSDWIPAVPSHYSRANSVGDLFMPPGRPAFRYPTT